jgi:hypothetical protein
LKEKDCERRDEEHKGEDGTSFDIKKAGDLKIGLGRQDGKTVSGKDQEGWQNPPGKQRRAKERNWPNREP